MSIAMCEADGQCELDSCCKAPEAGALGRPRWAGGRPVGGQDGAHMHTHGFLAMYGKNHHRL